MHLVSFIANMSISTGVFFIKETNKDNQCDVPSVSLPNDNVLLSHVCWPDGHGRSYMVRNRTSGTSAAMERL